jgi:hypothetical protein
MKTFTTSPRFLRFSPSATQAKQDLAPRQFHKYHKASRAGLTGVKVVKLRHSRTQFGLKMAWRLYTFKQTF